MGEFSELLRVRTNSEWQPRPLALTKGPFCELTSNCVLFLSVLLPFRPLTHSNVHPHQWKPVNPILHLHRNWNRKHTRRGNYAAGHEQRDAATARPAGELGGEASSAPAQRSPECVAPTAAATVATAASAATKEHDDRQWRNGHFRRHADIGRISGRRRTSTTAPAFQSDATAAPAALEWCGY